MGLIECPDCNGKVSDSAKSCPHCGRPRRGKAIWVSATGHAAPNGFDEGHCLCLLPYRMGCWKADETTRVIRVEDIGQGSQFDFETQGMGQYESEPPSALNYSRDLQRPFKVGDLVNLKSGGPIMNVERVAAYPTKPSALVPVADISVLEDLRVATANTTIWCGEPDWQTLSVPQAQCENCEHIMADFPITWAGHVINCPNCGRSLPLPRMEWLHLAKQMLHARDDFVGYEKSGTFHHSRLVWVV